MPEPIFAAAGPVLLLARDDVDTDAIYPSRFLRTTKRTGLGPALFADWRTAHLEEFRRFEGTPCIHATVLVAGRNFGCGSSREHAVWALADCGVRAIVALSFGDIFYSNCLRNGIIPATVAPLEHRAIVDALAATETTDIGIDVRQRLVKLADGARLPFQLEAGDAERLLSGTDEIAATLALHQHLLAYEQRTATEMPWLAPWQETT